MVQEAQNKCLQRRKPYPCGFHGDQKKECRCTPLQIRRYRNRISGQRLVDLVLFGSRARGEAEGGSDYDIMVVLNGNVDRRIERQATRGIILPLCRKYDVVIMCHFVGSDRYRQEQSPFMMNVRREGVLV